MVLRRADHNSHLRGGMRLVREPLAIMLVYQVGFDPAAGFDDVATKIG